MGKTNIGVKRLRFVKKFLLAQISILILFGSSLYMSHPVNPEDVKDVNVVVDKTKYIYNILGFRRFIIYSNSNRYEFGNMGIFGEYSNRKLYETIEVGEHIFIKYEERYSLFGKRNWVVEACTDTRAYRTFDQCNKQQKDTFIGFIIIFILFELLFLGISCIYYIINMW